MNVWPGLLRRTCIGLLEPVLAQSCRLCTASCGQRLLCPDCLHLLKHPDCSCPRCAMPSPLNQVCGQCLKTPPAFDLTIAALHYGFPADLLIRELKFGAKLPIADLLGRLLLERVRHRMNEIDIVIPMPLHRKRLAERGFNQALELMRPMRQLLHKPLLTRYVRRLRHTPAQADLPASRRRSNMRGAFKCELDFTARKIAIVDDVMTTGTTLGELAAVLKRAGASHVENWVVARTLAE